MVANKLGDDDDVKKSKFKYVFRRVFPDYKSFKKYHPLICRYKVLVPFGYLFRIIKLPFTGWKRAMAELEKVGLTLFQMNYIVNYSKYEKDWLTMRFIWG